MNLRYHKQFVIIFSLICFSNCFAYAQEIEADKIGTSISPIYEQMLANEIDLLRREMVSKKEIKAGDDFHIASFNHDQLSPFQIAAFLNHRYPSVHWRIGTEENKLFQGIFLINEAAKLKEAIRYIKNRGAEIILFTDQPVDEKLTAQLKESGFQIHSQMSLFELEYVEDEKGRQIVDLSNTRYQNQIFVRLVREGMNPVNAHTATAEAVQNFRKLREPRLLILDKITA